MVAGLRFCRRGRMPAPPLPPMPPRVAILKPLHGVNESLRHNLASYLEADYPVKEFIFGVSSRSDRASEVALALAPDYQGNRITLEVGHHPCAANNKVGKLVRMARRAADAEVFVLSDADTAVDPEYLKRVVGELCADDLTGVVTCLYRAVPGSSNIGAQLEASFVNTDFMPMALLAQSFEPLSYAFGATIAIKRKVLEEVGGFEALKDLLADDFYLGNRAFHRGYHIKLSSKPVTIVTNERTFSDFWIHQLRWARTYRSVRPGSVAMVLTYGPFWSLLLAFATRFNPLALEFAAGVIAVRYVMGAFMVRAVARLPLSLPALFFLPVKDLINTGIWFISLMGRTVTWGDRRFRILSTGRLEEIGAAEGRRKSAPSP
jgi:ceramide glucosyltransferase